jgi:arsenate reductase (glutaredoxin)
VIKVYHNTDCSKSNACLLFLEESGKPYEVVDYLNQAPTADELKSLIAKLALQPIALVRTNEAIWIEKFERKTLTDNQIIEAMAAYPILIQRPIVTNGDKAVIARPLDKAASIL